MRLELGLAGPNACVVYRTVADGGLYHAGAVCRRVSGEWEALTVSDVPTNARSFPMARTPFEAAALVRGPLLPSRLREDAAPVKASRISAEEGPRHRTIKVGGVAWRLVSDAAGSGGRLMRYGRHEAHLTWRLLASSNHAEVLLAPVDPESALVDLPRQLLDAVEFWCVPEAVR